MTRKYYLVVPAAGVKPPRIVSTVPHRVKPDEIFFRLVVNVPDSWGKIQKGEIVVSLPEPTYVSADAEGVTVNVTVQR